ncbi:MAG TPA: hypothetical protein VLC07_00920 [Solirubrobacterales bacterium]|nr:hypothetical protein [Solirubrobacterales bacterium]
MSAGVEIVEAASTELVIPEEFAEFVPDGLPTTVEKVEVWVARAKETVAAIEINSEEEAKRANELLKTYAREAKRFEDERVDLTKPRKDAAEFIKAHFDRASAPFLEAKADLKARLKAWQDAEAEKRREAQRRIEEERRRVEEEARTAREAAEQAAVEAAGMAAEAEGEEDAAVAAELAAEARRDAERAGVTEQAIQAVPAQAPVSAPKLDGFVNREQWEAEVVDFAALPDTLPDGTPLKVVDTSALRTWMYAQLKANGGVAPELSGAKFEKRPAGTSVRS